MLQSDVAKTERLFQFAYLLISLSLWLVSPLFVWFLFVTDLINSLVRIGSTTSPPLSANNSVIMTSLTSVYFVTIFASIFCNSMIILIIRTRHFLTSVTNYLILNQAYADLIITFTTMLGMLGDDLFFKKWFGGDWGPHLCRPLVWLNFPAEYCSIWSLVAIALWPLFCRGPSVTFVFRIAPYYVCRYCDLVVVYLFCSWHDFHGKTSFRGRNWLRFALLTFPSCPQATYQASVFWCSISPCPFWPWRFCIQSCAHVCCLEKCLEVKLVRMRGTRKP